MQDMNKWCNYAHNRQCSFAGVYQPDLPPPGPFGDFWGFGGFAELWSFLDLGTKASMAELRNAATKVCKMDFKQLEAFNRHKKAKARESR